MNSISDKIIDSPIPKLSDTTENHWKNALKESTSFLLLVIPYLIVSALLISKFNPSAGEYIPSILLQSFLASLIFFAAPLTVFSITLVVRLRPPSIIRMVASELRKGPLSAERLPKLIIAWACLAVFMSTFVEMKAIIPFINDFSYDVTLQQWDKWLHFGTHPFQWIQPLFFSDRMTIAVHASYYLWFSVMFTTYIWQAASNTDPELRLQFIIAFFASWILIGTVLAVSLSSAGPIFYDRLPTGDPHIYAAALAHLERINESTPLLAIQIRDMLWGFYAGEARNATAKGISAMPSMHVAISFLLALFGWRKGKIAGLAYTVFGITILLGSIHLLWHYAIDGYVSILAVSLIWWLSGKAARHTLAKAQA